jgi:predicted acyltransferase
VLLGIFVVVMLEINNCSPAQQSYEKLVMNVFFQLFKRTKSVFNWICNFFLFILTF